MAHLDLKNLSKEPIAPGKHIIFADSDFWDENTSYDVKIISGEPDDARPYCFHFTDGYLDIELLVEKEEALRKLFFELGVIPKDFFDGNAELCSDVVAVRSWRGDDEDKKVATFYFYDSDEIEFVLNPDLAAVKRPLHIIEIPDDSTVFIKTRGDVGYSTVIVYADADKKAKHTCNGACPGCKCGGSFEEYNGC